MHGRRFDHVVVVQDQQQLVPCGLGGQLVDQRGHQPLEGWWWRRTEERGDSLGEPGPHPVQGGDHMAPEPGGVVVALVQRQPGDRPLALPGPVGQQAGLAEPGRRADQHQPPRQTLVERLHEAWAGHKARRRMGKVQLGGQQLIRPARARLLDGRCGRFSHRAPAPLIAKPDMQL
jgi:hypothetical protein